MSTPHPFRRILELQDSVKVEKNSGKRQRMKDEIRKLEIDLGRDKLIREQEVLDAKNLKVPESKKVTRVKNAKTKT